MTTTTGTRTTGTPNVVVGQEISPYTWEAPGPRRWKAAWVLWGALAVLAVFAVGVVVLFAVSLSPGSCGGA